MLDPAAIETYAKAAAETARSEERGWISGNPNTAVLIAYLAGFVTFGVLALVL
jgi:hypothetical protein